MSPQFPWWCCCQKPNSGMFAFVNTGQVTSWICDHFKNDMVTIERSYLPTFSFSAGVTAKSTNYYPARDCEGNVHALVCSLWKTSPTANYSYSIDYTTLSGTTWSALVHICSGTISASMAPRVFLAFSNTIPCMIMDHGYDDQKVAIYSLAHPGISDAWTKVFEVDMLANYGLGGLIFDGIGVSGIDAAHFFGSFESTYISKVFHFKRQSNGSWSMTERPLLKNGTEARTRNTGIDNIRMLPASVNELITLWFGPNSVGGNNGIYFWSYIIGDASDARESMWDSDFNSRFWNNSWSSSCNAIKIYYPGGPGNNVANTPRMFMVTNATPHQVKQLQFDGTGGVNFTGIPTLTLDSTGEESILDVQCDGNGNPWIRTDKKVRRLVGGTWQTMVPSGYVAYQYICGGY